MTNRYPITKVGYEKAKEELRIFKTKDRPSVIQAISEARAHGDLSENAEYHAAKEKQGFIEAKIAELDDIVLRAEVIDNSNKEGDEVMFGATVRLIDEEIDEEKEYKIVSNYESNVSEGLLSINSPLAKALLGKKEGHSFEFVTGKRVKNFQILSLKFV